MGNPSVTEITLILKDQGGGVFGTKTPPTSAVSLRKSLSGENNTTTTLDGINLSWNKPLTDTAGVALAGGRISGYEVWEKAANNRQFFYVRTIYDTGRTSLSIPVDTTTQKIRNANPVTASNTVDANDSDATVQAKLDALTPGDVLYSDGAAGPFTFSSAGVLFTVKSTVNGTSDPITGYIHILGINGWQLKGDFNEVTEVGSDQDLLHIEGDFIHVDNLETSFSGDFGIRTFGKAPWLEEVYGHDMWRSTITAGNSHDNGDVNDGLLLWCKAERTHAFAGIAMVYDKTVSYTVDNWQIKGCLGYRCGFKQDNSATGEQGNCDGMQVLKDYHDAYDPAVAALVAVTSVETSGGTARFVSLVEITSVIDSPTNPGTARFTFTGDIPPVGQAIITVNSSESTYNKASAVVSASGTTFFEIAGITFVGNFPGDFTGVSPAVGQPIITQDFSESTYNDSGDFVSASGVGFFEIAGITFVATGTGHSRVAPNDSIADGRWNAMHDMEMSYNIALINGDDGCDESFGEGSGFYNCHSVNGGPSGNRGFKTFQIHYENVKYIGNSAIEQNPNGAASSTSRGFELIMNTVADGNSFPVPFLEFVNNTGLNNDNGTGGSANNFVIESNPTGTFLNNMSFGAADQITGTFTSTTNHLPVDGTPNINDSTYDVVSETLTGVTIREQVINKHNEITGNIMPTTGGNLINAGTFNANYHAATPADSLTAPSDPEDQTKIQWYGSVPDIGEAQFTEIFAPILVLA